MMEQRLEIFNRLSCPKSEKLFVTVFFCTFLKQKKDRVIDLHDPC